MDEALYRRLFEQYLVPASINELLRDGDGTATDFRFLAVNDAFAQATERSREQLVGRTFRSVFPELDAEWVRLYQLAVDSGRQLHVTRQLAPFPRWCEVMATPLGGDRFAVSFLEVTDRCLTHREQRRTLAVLHDALRAAESANIAKAQFLSVMSHEIRTPLNGIMGMADLLAEQLADEEQRAMACTIKACGQALLAVVSDVLDLARLEAGGLAIDPQPSDPRSLTESVHAAFLAQAQRKGLHLQLRIAPAVPSSVMLDAVRVKQVLMNFVSNAVKFTERGSIMVRLDAVPRGSDAAELLWEVVDTGPGIAPEHLPRIWEPFYQADGSLSRRHGGTGLGLAICRRLADAMRGEVSADSMLGYGSCFRLRLTVSICSLAAPSANGSDKPPGTAPPPWQRPPRVLVVEDDPTCQLAMRLMLQALGCAMELASDGEQAVQLCRAASYDLILMDLQMPVCDGFTATQRIRALDGRMHGVPIVAVTANAFTADRERAAAVGMDDFLAKPLLLPTLRQCLTTHLAGLLPAETKH